MITLLKPEHLELFLELKREVPGSWKLGAEYDTVVDPKMYYMEYLMHEQYYTIGYIENGKLISMASMFEFSDTPGWSLIYLCAVNLGFNSVVKTKSNILISELFEESLRRKLTSVVALVRLNYPSFDSSMFRKWKKLIPQFEYYNFYRETVIPANTVPKYKYQEWLMGSRTWPVDLKIDNMVLKQEYRERFLI